MNAETKGVDVLAVMRDAELLGSLAYATPETMIRLRRARIAVAELIEAGNAWRDLMPGLAGGPEFDRLCDALDRAGGAA